MTGRMGAEEARESRGQGDAPETRAPLRAQNNKTKAGQDWEERAQTAAMQVASGQTMVSTEIIYEADLSNRHRVSDAS